jgi:hypothetical protein
MMSGKRVQRLSPTDDEPVLGWGFTIWTMLLGVFFMGSPKWFCGPSWSYFPQLPHNSFGMGLCLTVLSVTHAAARLRRSSNHIVSIVLFLKGFVFWTAGITLGAEGLLGHQGLMEAPLMMWIGAEAFSYSSKAGKK